MRHSVLGKLNDQNRVFGGQSQSGQKTDLKIHVIGKPPPGSGNGCAQQSQRQHEQVGNGNGPAFIQGCHAQKNDQNGKRIQQRSLCGGHAFLIGKTGPVKSDSLRQFSSEFLHCLHGFARTSAWCGFSLYVHGRKRVEPLQSGRTGGPFSCGKRGKGNHFAGNISHIKFVQILWQHAELCVCLHIDPFDPFGLNKVIDIGTAERGCDGAVDGTDGNTQSACFFPVHIHAVLGNILHAVGTDTRQQRILRCHAKKLVSGIHQSLMPQPAFVLQLKIKTCGISQFHYRRRRKGKDHGFPNLGKCSHGSACHSPDFQIRTFPKMPVFETDECQSHVLSPARETDA